ncbi:GPI transamidase component PIG-T isoform X1 [Hydra vulgaris]|uniref:GPI transamidase component PIG-T isoform X1 n=1 Tax=Hydra vulgaris TaxID=6087 RepID=UPI001F5E39D7|nr:GPI transamidase component PIG-T isoform X1 [Hydra vulgaris]
MCFKILLLILLVSTIVNGDSFSEELFLKQLPSGHLYSLFQFTNSLEVNLFDNRLPEHFNLFPKSFAEIIEKFHVLELHLSLTQGRWQYSKWGYPVISAPTGIELWAWFNPDLDRDNVNINWNGLLNALSGLFCSSLNFINKESTSSPNFTFKPQGVWPNDINATLHLRHATLPKETVCTENLTPWKKLLPCGSEAGLASLLIASHLFDSSYHSLAVHLRSVCDGDCDDVYLELKQTLSLVFDPHHTGINKDWSLKPLFGSGLHSTCPLASSSNIIVDIEYELKDKINPQPNLIRAVTSGDNQLQRAIFNLKQIKDLDQGFELYVPTNKKRSHHVNLPYLTTHKYATGYGVEMGGIFCIIKNTHATESFYLTYFEVVPYFLRVYFSTFKVKINNILVVPDRLTFKPANMREQPTSIEFTILLPPQSSLTIEYEFENVFLDWLQHPPDSHHGYYVGSSVISGKFPDFLNSTGISELCSYITSFEKCNRGTDLLFRRIYTELLLISVPLPDFSMPYNVICLTCTVIAIAFGSIFNITTRTFQVEEKNVKKGLLDQLKRVFSKVLCKSSNQ